MTKLVVLIALLVGAIERERIAATLRPIVTILSHQRDRIGAVR